MVLQDMLKLLNKIKQCHPEAGNADMWAISDDGKSFPVSFVGYDKRHKPARIKLEQ